MFRKFLKQFRVSDASEEYSSECVSWNEYVEEFNETKSLVWLLQEQMNLTNILDLTVRTHRSMSSIVTESIVRPLFIISNPKQELLREQICHLYSLLDYDSQSYEQYTSKWKWQAYQTEPNLHPDTLAVSNTIDIYEIIPLSVPTNSVQWLDPRWNATLIALEIKFNGVTSEVDILVLHCSHTDAAKLFAQTNPTAIILNGLTETSDPHPYRKDASIVESVTNLNPKFVAIDTPEFINDKAHTAGVVEWYTVENGEWTPVSE